MYPCPEVILVVGHPEAIGKGKTLVQFASEAWLKNVLLLGEEAAFFLDLRRISWVFEPRRTGSFSVCPRRLET